MADREARGSDPDGGCETTQSRARTRGPGKYAGAWAEEFLSIYEERGNLSAARTHAGVSRSALYKLRDRDPEFAKAWEDIRQGWIDRIADGVMRRAMVGVRRVRRYPSARKVVKGKDGVKAVETTYDEIEEREHSFSRERWILERLRPDEFGVKERSDLSAAEYAQRVHSALEGIDASMDEDRPEEGEE